MSNKIIYGDCLEVMYAIPDQSIDLILADLPFGVTRNPWDSLIPLAPLWAHYKRITKPNSAIILHGQDKFSAMLMLSNPKMHRYNLIWEKNSPKGHLNAKKMPLRSHEDILVFYDKRPVYNPQKTTGHRPVNRYTKHTTDGTNYGKTKTGISGGGSTERYPRSVLKFASDTQKSSLHPTQKPVPLLEYLILTYSNPDAIVLDNVAGSGSTGVACVNTGRDYILIEKDLANYNICVERLAAMTI